MFKQALVIVLIMFIVALLYLLFIHKSWERMYEENYNNFLKDYEMPDYFNNMLNTNIEFPNYLTEKYVNNNTEKYHNNHHSNKNTYYEPETNHLMNSLHEEGMQTETFKQINTNQKLSDWIKGKLNNTKVSNNNAINIFNDKDANHVLERFNNGESIEGFSTVPSDVKISCLPGDRIITVTWNKPNIKPDKYIILAYKTNDHTDGVRVEVAEDPESNYDGPYYNYTVSNLENGIYYTIGVIAVKSDVYSRLSNIVDIKPVASSIIEREKTIDSILSKEVAQLREDEQLVQRIIHGIISQKDSLLDALNKKTNNTADLVNLASCIGENSLATKLENLNQITINIS